LSNERQGPAAVIVNTPNPRGVPTADDIATDIADAHRRANASDPVSAFGGIVALNRPATASLARSLAEVFTEVVVAPEYEPAALEIFATKKNLRVLEAPTPGETRLDVRTIDGGL